MSEFLWVEKYRPQKIDDCILVPRLRKEFNAMIESGEVQNLMLCGSQGTGKTTVAKAICKQLDLDYLMINGSKENGIDVLRNKITQFASTYSMNGGIKVVILDEADYLNVNSVQPALRGFIEEFSENCRFILTCNYKNRLIPPLHSRCTVIEFDTKKKDLVQLAGGFMTRLRAILQNENVKFDNEVIAELIKKHAPDWRRVINECQRHASGGEITTEILADLKDSNINHLHQLLKAKDFKAMRQWVAENSSLSSMVVFRKIYDSMNEHLDPSCIPNAVLIIADYSYKSAFVADQEINMVACMTELMGTLQWK